MKAVLQRVQEASVSINGDVVSHISKGFLILLGIEAQDGEEQARILANKTTSLRGFEDENGKLWKNTDCCSPRECCEERGDTLNSSAGNEFDGEPDCFMAAHIKVEYLPEEGGEQDG